jgi:lipooligosaccharide transport system permease protein
MRPPASTLAMYLSWGAPCLAAFHVAGLVTLHLTWLPALLPVSLLAACAFGALGLCFTATLPTIDHMNLSVFLLVLPMGMLSSTYFPLEHPLLVALNLANPLYHLAQAFRGLLIGGPVAAPLAAVIVLSIILLAILVPLDVRLVRRRILGD